MRAEYAEPELLRFLMAAMQPENALALEVSLETGLRIDDVLSLRSADLSGRTLTVVEKKTGKPAKKVIKPALADRLRRNAAGERLFPSLRAEHRARSTVYVDLKKAAKRYGVRVHMSPHSARKAYAVQVYRENGLSATQRALNHDNAGTTLIYALSDVLTERSGEERGDRPEQTAQEPFFAGNGKKPLEMLEKLLEMVENLTEKVDKLIAEQKKG